MKATKLPSGNYRVQVVEGYNASGKRIVKSFTAKTEWEALSMAEDYKNGIYRKTSNLTVFQAIEEYIRSRDNILSPTTIDGYENIRDTRLQSIRNFKIADLKCADIQKAVNEDAKRLSRKSVKSALALLKGAALMQGVELNVSNIALPSKKYRKKDIPTADQILSIIIGTDIELPCLLAMWLSLRISEVRGLQFRDISDDGKYISIQRARLYVEGSNIIRDQTKTEKSTRVNRLPKYLYSLITSIPHKKEDDFIVDMEYMTLYVKFKKLMKENGLDISFHTLRHEFASTLNDLGIPSDYIQKIGGWSTNKIMKMVYTHTNSAGEEKFQKVIDDYFDSVIADVTRESHA